jgi:TRAP-type mannitol/chloroaromatic compound transport system substrate-binding protein
MKRRKLINHIALGTASYGLLTSCNSGTTEYDIGGESGKKLDQPLIEWRCASSWSSKLSDTVYGGVQDLCLRVSQITNGRFQITSYPEGEIVPALNVFDAVSENTVECGHTAPSYYVKKNSAFTFCTTVPFGFNAKQQMSWLYANQGLELARKLYAQYNIINFPAANSTNQMGGWYKKKVNSVGDLKGLKVRLSGFGGEIFKRLGAEVVIMPGSQIVSALKQDTLDAAEFTGPSDDLQLGFLGVTPYYYYPGWHQPGSGYDFIVNLDEYNSLPSSYKEALAVAATEAYGTTVARYNVANIRDLQTIIEGGTQLESFSDDIMSAAQKVAFEIYEENAASNPDFKEIYERWKVFRQEIFAWTKINEVSYMDFAFNNI